MLTGPGEAAATELRAAIVASPAFRRLAGEMPSTKSPYLDVLCANAREGCTAVAPSLLPLLSLAEVAEATRLLLGDDYLLDSARLSVQWPGSARFGPHVDHPLKRGPNAGDWKYSSGSMPLPPKDYPLSVQAVFALDNFTAENGAFFVLPPAGWQGPARYDELAERHDMGWLREEGAKVVTARAGEVLLAHGAVWHGALPNYSPRPCLALLVQFVPRFVRPGQRYPRSLVPEAAPAPLAAELERLLDLSPKGQPSRQVVLRNAAGQTLLDRQLDLSRPAEAERSLQRSMALLGLSDPGAVARQVVTEAVEAAVARYEMCRAPAEQPQGELMATLLSPDEQREQLGGRVAAEAQLGRLSFGFGSATGSLSPVEAGELVKAVLRQGYRALDLADVFPHQKAIGAALAEVWDASGAPRLPGYPPRSAVHISSKLWATNMAPEHVSAALDATLAALRLSYIDRWLVHWPVPLAFVGTDAPGAGQIWPQQAESGETLFARGFTLSDTWRAMEDLVLEGSRVRAIGLSNTPASLVHQLVLGGAAPLRVLPQVNQVELHPWLPQAGLRAACQALGVPLEPYAPLASGQPELLADPRVAAVAERHGLAPAELLAAWAAQAAGGVSRVVYSTRDPARAERMMRAAQRFPNLSQNDLAAIMAVPTRRRIFAPSAFAFLFA